MSTYYATKSYVYSMTEAINYELRKSKSNVVVSVLAPGPVDTNFNNVAGVQFVVKPLSASYVAKYALDMLLEKKKMLIIPGFRMKCIKFFSRFVSFIIVLSNIFCYDVLTLIYILKVKFWL